MATDSQPPPPPADQRAQRTLSILVVALCGLVLAIPAIAMLAGAPAFFAPQEDSQQPGSERRERVRAKLHRFANEGYPLAEQLAEWGGRLKVDILGETASDMVILGKQEWLFFATDGADVITRRHPQWEARDLDLLARWFEANRQAVSARGMHYVVLFTPGKSSIHPEFLPESVQPLDRPRHLAVLTERLRENSRLKVIDSTEAVRAAKPWSQQLAGNPTPGWLYQRSDTHWNDLGAWGAAEALLAELRPLFPTLPNYGRDDFILRVEKRSGGDLARFMALHERTTDVFPALRWQNVPGSDEKHHREDLVVKYVTTGSDNPDLPRAVIFRDSFSQRLIPLLTPFFDQITWLWNYYLLDAATLDGVRATGADIVIHQISERPLATRVFQYDAVKELRRWQADHGVGETTTD